MRKGGADVLTEVRRVVVRKQCARRCQSSGRQREDIADAQGTCTEEDRDCETEAAVSRQKRPSYWSATSTSWPPARSRSEPSTTPTGHRALSGIWRSASSTLLRVRLFTSEPTSSSYPTAKNMTPAPTKLSDARVCIGETTRPLTSGGRRRSFEVVEGLPDLRHGERTNVRPFWRSGHVCDNCRSFHINCSQQGRAQMVNWSERSTMRSRSAPKSTRLSEWSGHSSTSFQRTLCCALAPTRSLLDVRSPTSQPTSLLDDVASTTTATNNPTNKRSHD